MGQQTATDEKPLDEKILDEKILGEKTLGEKALEDWRRQIDALDTDLVRLLNQRAVIACEIARIKVASGLPAYDGKREDQVLASVAEKNCGPLDEQSVTSIFRSIIEETRRLGTERMKFLNLERSEGLL